MPASRIPAPTSGFGLCDPKYSLPYTREIDTDASIRGRLEQLVKLLVFTRKITRIVFKNVKNIVFFGEAGIEPRAHN